MTLLIEVQSGQAIALLMQGKTQQQVAMKFGVNVSTKERLVHRLRETGRLANLHRTGRDDVRTVLYVLPTSVFGTLLQHKLLTIQ